MDPKNEFFNDPTCHSSPPLANKVPTALLSTTKNKVSCSFGYSNSRVENRTCLTFPHAYIYFTALFFHSCHWVQHHSCPCLLAVYFYSLISNLAVIFFQSVLSFQFPHPDPLQRREGPLLTSELGPFSSFIRDESTSVV